jgi:hypothetical protein
MTGQEDLDVLGVVGLLQDDLPVAGLAGGAGEQLTSPSSPCSMSCTSPAPSSV